MSARATASATVLLVQAHHAVHVRTGTAVPAVYCNVAPLDPFHLACVCTNATMVAWRTAAQAQARVLLDKIALLLRVAHSEMQRDLKTLCDEVSCESAALDVSAGSGQFILFRLLVMMPWSARAAEGDLSLYTVAVSGALFDSSGMPNRFLRPLADTWGHWSIRWCWRLGKAWRAACMLRNVSVDGA